MTRSLAYVWGRRSPHAAVFGMILGAEAALHPQCVVAPLLSRTVRLVGPPVVTLAALLALSTALLAPVATVSTRLSAVWLLAPVSVTRLLAGVTVLLLAVTESGRLARLPLTPLQPVRSLLMSALPVGLLAPLIVLGISDAGDDISDRFGDAAVTASVTLLTPSSAMPLALLGVLTLLMLLTLLAPLLTLLVPDTRNDVLDRFGDAALAAVLMTTPVSTAYLAMLSLVCPWTPSMDALRVDLLVLSRLLSFVSVLTEVVWKVCHRVGL